MGRFCRQNTTENSGYSIEIFPKNQKIRNYWYKIRSKPNKLGRKHRKFTKFMTLHNTAQISEKFSPIITKTWHFLKCYNNYIPNSVNCSHIKISKEQLTAHTPIVKRITVSVTNTHLSFSNALLCQLVSQNAQITKTTKTCGYCKLQHKRI